MWTLCLTLLAADGLLQRLTEIYKGKRCLRFGATSPIDPGVNSTSDSRSSPRTPAEERVRRLLPKVLFKSHKEIKKLTFRKKKEQILLRLCSLPFSLNWMFQPWWFCRQLFFFLYRRLNKGACLTRGCHHLPPRLSAYWGRNSLTLGCCYFLIVPGLHLCLLTLQQADRVHRDL